MDNKGILMRLVFYAILALIIYYLLRGLWGPKPRGQDAREFEDELVKDPVCDTYIPKNKAISVKIGNKRVYFCSKECKERYLEEMKRRRR